MIHISKILKILPSLHFHAGHSHSIQSPSTTTQSKRHRSQLMERDCQNLHVIQLWIPTYANYLQFWPKTLVRIWLEFVPSAWKTPHNPHCFQFFPNTPLGPRCISPTQHLLSRVPGHQISKPRSPESSGGFFFAACVERRRSCTTVACSVRNCSFATSQEFVQQNSEMIKEYFSALLIKAAQSSQKSANQPS